jgi:hypothetical protein
MRIQPAELIVMIAIVVGIAFAARYYFVVYRNSPGYALSSYLGSINHGNVESQYSLVDATDKQKFFPTRRDYEQHAPQAYGYVARIQSFNLTEPKPDPKNPNLVSIKVRIDVRGSLSGTAGGISGLKSNADQTLDDEYTLRKDDEGKWKVVLSRSKRALLKVPPTPPGDPINS